MGIQSEEEQNCKFCLVSSHPVQGSLVFFPSHLLIQLFFLVGSVSLSRICA